MMQITGWKKALTMIVCLMLFFSALGINVPTTLAEENAEDESVDYILILDCTVRAVNSDEEGIRKAAAKMFVDLLPVDNARLAVFKIGNRDENAQNRKADSAKSYKLRADNNHMVDALYRMQCVYQLWDFDRPISDIKQREELKSIIDSAYVQNPGSYSDTHCAVYAAMDTLKHWDSKNACILLVSQEFTAAYNQHKVRSPHGIDIDSDHTMWDDVQSSLLNNRNWVMNWVDLGSGTPEVRTIIDGLCKINDGEASYDFQIEKLPEMIATIVSKYTGSNEEGRSQVLDASGNATIELPDFIMLTEANVVITGDGVNKVTVTDGKGSKIDKPKDDIWFSTNYDPQNKSHFLYSAVKMIRPANRGWSVNVQGKAGTQVYVQAIHTLEPDILLTCNYQADQKGVIGVGTNLQFTATYQYAGENLHCGNDAYNHYLSDAKLYYTHSSNPDKRVDISNALRVESEQYVADFTVQQRGTYNFYFYVETNDFKSGIRNSNPIENITVENHAPQAVGTISDIKDVPVGSKLDGIANIHELFSDEDNEQLTYVIEVKKDGRASDVSYQVAEDGFLSVDVPGIDGVYEFGIYAEDTNKAQSQVVRFTVGAINEGPQLKLQPEKTKLISHAPEMLVSMGLLPKEESRDYEIDLNELFGDPEGLPLEFQIEADNLDEDGKEIIIADFDSESGKLTVSAENKGKASVVIHALDSAGAMESTNLEISVRTVGAALWARYWWVPVVLVIIILIILALLASRRVHGRWNIEIDDIQNKTGCSHSFVSIPSSRDKKLMKTKVSLQAIAKCAVRVEGALEEIQTSPLKEKTIIFCGTLLAGRSVKFIYTPSQRAVVSIDEGILTKAGKYELKRNQVLEVVCKDVDDSDVLSIKASFR